ncbi:DEAD/DEAH box helicase [Ruminococcus albus]|uniref:Helicase C-terminal domain protein n=1 Tax=Ruminococcus albus 8 TaxID=246199 RepID=E9SEW6_RUMAL|nr:DEAD/DEAH box helicase [Ruminococcus albus]EGC02171.1 helicase C-terminal domain protein [Ruminococcus albus 8]MCC3350795.1 DEAD/DEAH box helicase [Ruminococcus albus 8]
MIEYAPGMRLIIRDEEWMIKKIDTNEIGAKALTCIGISPLVKDKEAIFLDDLEKIDPVDPTKVRLIKDNSPKYTKSLLYLESQWRQKAPTDKNIHIGHRAAMDLMPFQLEPTKISLNRTRCRILVADTVGLGKTLEAGILMSELIIRGKGKRILVVTSKSMMTQFQKEMWNRFIIPLVRLDSHKIQKIRASLPSNYNPFFYYDKVIVSIDTIKRDVEYRTHLENAYWDIIVIDEAQGVAERGSRDSQRSRLANILKDRSDTMIMLSATPHDGRAKSFASLMNMLDPTAIANPEEYTKDEIKGLCIRRFKKDVKDQMGGKYLERTVNLVSCEASPKEEAVFDIFAQMQLDMDTSKPKGTGQLFKTSLEKSLFSSPKACLKSVEERLRKLRHKYPDGEIKDIALLEELRDALALVEPRDFSRYTKLLELLRSSEYNWNPKKVDDRIVIFTERIETMKFLAKQLREDLHMSDKQVVEISGGMTDMEQQRVVEEFGRTEAPVRILVASDVASEGLNLHYLSHRLIHFDIPWSLMVFQQRNGRIDRYGQEKRPDIRYMLISSKNERIKGDMRIIRILVEKEEQAFKNIGDPTLLLGKFNIEDEELVISETIENGSDAAAFEDSLHDEESEFDPLDFLLNEASMEETTTTVNDTVEDETLFTDKQYLIKALSYINKDEQHPLRQLSEISGVDVMLTEDMRRRLSAVIPEEAMPSGEILRLSDDKTYIMQKMRKSMQNSIDNAAWPDAQYLWAIHPVISWLNDKTGLLIGRGEAPVIGVKNFMQPKESIFIVEGSMPNERSAALVDDLFGVRYVDGKFVEFLDINAVVNKTKINSELLANEKNVTDEMITALSGQLEDVVAKAKEKLAESYRKYKEATDPLIDAEVDKLAELEERHKDYQLSLFTDERRKSEAERRVDELFDSFTKWVKETLDIRNNPYIRIITVLTGVE